MHGIRKIVIHFFSNSLLLDVVDLKPPLQFSLCAELEWETVMRATPSHVEIFYFQFIRLYSGHISLCKDIFIIKK